MDRAVHCHSGVVDYSGRFEYLGVWDMGYRRQNNGTEHIFVHGKGDWEQEALRRQRNFQFAVRVVMTSFVVVIDFFRVIHEKFFPIKHRGYCSGTRHRRTRPGG